MLLEISQNSQENTRARVSILISFSYLRRLYKDFFYDKSRVCSAKFYQIFGKIHSLVFPFFPAKHHSLKLYKKFLGNRMQWRIQNPVEHLRWRFLRKYTIFFYKQWFFSTQGQLWLTFLRIELQMLLTCWLIYISNIQRHLLYWRYLCPLCRIYVIVFSFLSSGSLWLIV